MTRTVLVATWGDGLFVITGENRHQELAGQPVNVLASDGHGGALRVSANGKVEELRSFETVAS
jgi:hypothetical protein